jgi:hypothetical protein
MVEPLPDEPDLSTHPLVAKMQGAGDLPKGLVALTGFLGPSQHAELIRLYQGLDFQSFFEIPRDAIIATSPADAANELCPTVVYVKVGSSVTAVQTSTQTVESFLQGGITGDYLPGANTGGYLGAVDVFGTKCTICPCHSQALGPTPFGPFATKCGPCPSHPTPLLPTAFCLATRCPVCPSHPGP